MFWSLSEKLYLYSLSLFLFNFRKITTTVLWNHNGNVVVCKFFLCQTAQSPVVSLSLFILCFLEVMFIFLFAFYLVHQKCASPCCVSMNQRLRGIIAAHIHGGGHVADRKCVFLSALLAIFLSEHGNDRNKSKAGNMKHRHISLAERIMYLMTAA